MDYEFLSRLYWTSSTEDGCAKDTDALRASLDRIDLCMVKYDGDLTSLRCFAAVKDWVSAAWAQGVQRGVTA
jgi:hypothetical protein